VTENPNSKASGDLLPLSAVQAELGGYHKTTLYSWIKRGKFPKPVKIGGSSRWIADEIRAWKKERERMAERRQWPIAP
jgi:predicted DNA-binding transcriptional regulator AlpA